MKRIYPYLFIALSLLLISNGAQAQLAAGRSQSTIIADALAQLPAETPEQYNAVIADLMTTGEEGLLDLIGRMNPPGDQTNEALDFAITGWTHYAATREDTRRMTANALEKALTQQEGSKEVKAFIIRRMRTIATDENVDVLASFLTDDYLSSTASLTLLSINTENAHQALLNTLRSSNDAAIQLNMVNALGQTRYEPAEPVLLELLKKNPTGDMQKAVFHALANTGTRASVKALSEAAKATNYSYQKENATASYLALLTKLSPTEPKLVEKEAKRLLSVAKKQDQQDMKLAATRLLLANPSAKTTNILQDAIKDGNLAYLTGVLYSYPFHSDTKAVDLARKELARSQSPEVQTALIHWMGNNNIENVQKLAAPLTKSPDYTVQKAASRALAKEGGEQSLLALAAMLMSNDENTVTLGKNALLTFEGDISYTLASVFDQSGDAGKIAILELIANRKMESQYNLVYNQLFTDNEAVKAVAASTLQAVVTDENLPDLFTLLEQPGQSHLAEISQAINAGLSHLPAAKQLELVTDRMNRSANKHLYYSALANSGSDEALKSITEAYRTATGVEKDAAFDALAGWESFNVIYPLLDIARETNDARELEKLTTALIAVIRGSSETGAVKYLYAREVMDFAQTDRQKNELIRIIGTTGQYPAMLYVAPYMDQPALSETAAIAAMNIAIGNPDFAGEKTTEILNKVSKTLTNPDADYQRQSITKYLSENPTEGGYVSMFNGQNLDGWKGLVENPIVRSRMSERELAAAQKKSDAEMARDWKVEDGNIVFDGSGYNNLSSVKQYGDFDMLVDWKLYEGAEPDAGIYLRGTPQVQIWDTSRVDVGAQVGSGGLYNNVTHRSTPLKVADLRVGDWNTFRIRMIGDRVSVWLNGELVTDNVILENYWDRNQPIFPVEQIELQAHGSKVAYRDIFIKEIERAEPFTLSAEEEKEGFKVLFDGTNMHHWTGNTTDYFIRDGVMVVEPQGNNTSGTRNLYTKEEFGNFVLRFEFMLTPGANNGLGIRTPMEGDAAYVGMELQILDDDAPIYKDLAEHQYHGSIYGVIPAKRGYLKPVGEWNYQEVIADGDRITVNLNGTTILDGDIREASKNGTLDNREHPGLLNEKGHIGFLGHGSKLKFRNIRIKEI